MANPSARRRRFPRFFRRVRVILEQQEAVRVVGVFLGTWHVLGRKLPGVSGVLTFIVRGEAVSVNVQGRLRDSSGRTTLVLEPLTVNGGRMTLTHPGEHRLVCPDSE